VGLRARAVRHQQRRTDLETVGSRVFAVWASCAGTGPAFGSQCTRFTLYSAPAAGGSWAPVGPATTGLTSGAASEAVSLALTSGRGYLLGPDGTLYSGPVDGSAPWTRAGSLASGCAVGPARGDGSPTGALLGAVSARELVVACVSGSAGQHPAASTQRKLVYSSPDGGASWLQMARAPAAAVAFGLAVSPSGSVLLGTDQGIDLLPAGGVAWQPASVTAGGPAGGFGYVGMTTDVQGVALPANPSSGTVWFTFNGGLAWKASAVRSP
jgi:hypothetical protein